MEGNGTADRPGAQRAATDRARLLALRMVAGEIIDALADLDTCAGAQPYLVESGEGGTAVLVLPDGAHWLVTYRYLPPVPLPDWVRP